MLVLSLDLIWSLVVFRCEIGIKFGFGFEFEFLGWVGLGLSLMDSFGGLV